MNYKVKDIKVGKEIVAKVFKFRRRKFKGIKFFTPNFEEKWHILRN